LISSFAEVLQGGKMKPHFSAGVLLPIFISIATGVVWVMVEHGPGWIFGPAIYTIANTRKNLYHRVPRGSALS